MASTAANLAADRLAIDGGAPARRRPDPPMYPGGNIGAEEEQAVVEVIRSKRLFRYYGPNPGPSQAAALEEAFARHMAPAARRCRHIRHRVAHAP